MSDLLKRIHRLREQQGIKPTNLAKQLGMSSSTFTDWGNGKGSPSLKAVIQFAEFFGVSTDYLIYGKEHSNSSITEFSNPEDKALLDAFHSLTPELKVKATAYIEGMAATLKEQSLNKKAVNLSS